MEPFGPGNMRPVFVAKKLIDTGFSKVVKEQHLRFSVKQNDIHFTGISFGMADKYALMQNNQLVDIVFTLDLNEFNGQQNLQRKVIDMKLSE